MGLVAKRQLIPAAFLVFLLLAATEMEIGEGRLCESNSHRFKGACLSSTNCGSVCRTEGFSGGDCRGLRRRCFCTKPCQNSLP